MKRFWSLILMVVLGGMLVSCGAEKRAATTAIQAAETAWAAAKDNVAKILPDEAKSVDEAIAAAKASLEQGDAKAALAAAKDLPARIQQLTAGLAAKEAELRGRPFQVEEAPRGDRAGGFRQRQVLACRGEADVDGSAECAAERQPRRGSSEGVGSEGSPEQDTHRVEDAGSRSLAGLGITGRGAGGKLGLRLASSPRGQGGSGLGGGLVGCDASHSKGLSRYGSPPCTSIAPAT